MRLTRHSFARRLFASILLAAAAIATLPALTDATAAAQEQRPHRRWSLLDLFAPPRRLEPPPVQRQPAVVRPRKKTRKVVVAPPEPEIPTVEKAPDARTVLVVGDFLGSGVAEGLNDAFAQDPTVRVIDRTKGSSGFVRDDFYDWPAEIGDLVAAEKPAAVVVMLGANDRQQMKLGDSRESVGSDAWLKEYAARAEELGAHLAEHKVPFLWVGLPAFKSSRMTSDMSALNDIDKAAAEKTGGEFVDIWDGFVDENGAFTTTGPDMNGQPVRLRSSDGINLTGAGKRKIAFYLEKPLGKLLGGTAPAPLAGPVLAPDASGSARLPAVDRTAPISLTDPELDGGSELLGATVQPAKKAGAAQPIGGVAPSAQTGRADDFAFGTVKPVVPVEETTAASR